MEKTNGYFETRLSHEPKRDAIWKPIVEYLQRFIPENAKILELGAGYCSFINQVKALEKHALDKSDIIKKYAHENVKTYVSDVSNLRLFHTGYFDVVFSSFLYEHLTREQLNLVMKEIRRILKKGGILITLLPNYKLVYKHYFDDYTHLQIFTQVSFSDYLVSHGYTIEKVESRFLPFSFKSRFPKSVLLTKLYLLLPFRPFAGNMLIVAQNPEIAEFSISPLNRRSTASSGPRTAPIPTTILKETKTAPTSSAHLQPIGRQSKSSTHANRDRTGFRRQEPRNPPRSQHAAPGEQRSDDSKEQQNQRRSRPYSRRRPGPRHGDYHSNSFRKQDTAPGENAGGSLPPEHTPPDNPKT